MAIISETVTWTAVETVARLKRREITPLDLIDSAAARIAAIEPRVNALPTLCLDRARERARKVPVAPPGGPWLAGLPVAIKDLRDVAGVRTTYGSPIFADHVPTRSDVSVEILESRGALCIAKSNTPEFGAGANTFNEVFGATSNPWNTAKTCGGSSGGAAVALATGEVWLASGSDFGGSLRTPASFCSVVGLRPSPGRVARGPKRVAFETLTVDGPMGRSVADAALLLDAMAGAHPIDPLSFASPMGSFFAAAQAPRAPLRVAFSPDLGLTPVAAEVKEICAKAARRFADHGAVVELDCPDFTDAVATFQVLRAANYAADRAELLRLHRAKLKPEVVWNIEKGLALSADAIGRAEIARGALYRRVATFFADYDVLACPAAIVPPFDLDQRYVASLDGHEFDNYMGWLAITFAVTLTGCPALSLPCGFTGEGLPVGLQLVGRPRGEADLLSAAALLEAELGLTRLLPIDPRPPAPRRSSALHPRQP